MKVFRFIFAFLLLFFLGIVESSLSSIEETASHQIDSSYQKIWLAKEIQPAPLSQDQEFVRRAYLDITGRIPTADQALAFLHSGDTQKRPKLIAHLVDTPEFSEYFSSIWTALFLGYKNNSFLDRGSFQDWLQTEIQRNHGWDRIVTQMVTAEGSLTETPALNWYVKQQLNAANLADDTSRLFLGIQLGCARCHNHPHDQWKLQDFYGLAAFFSGLKKSSLDRDDRMKLREVRLSKRKIIEKYKTPEIARTKAQDEFKALRDAHRDLLRLTQDSSDTITAEIQGKKQIYPAKFLLDPRPAHVTTNQRNTLATWITSPENPFFARAFVNRVWGMLLGRGFVQPVDDMGGANGPSNPELLDLLAKDFRDHGYNIKYLVATMANSRVYQLASESRSAAAEYEHGKIQMMNPDQLYHSFMIATGIETALRQTSLRPYEDRKQMIYQYHVSLFDNDETGQSMNFESTIPQALFLLNGKFTNEAVEPHLENTLSKILERKEPEARIDRLFLSAFSRHATPEEITRFAANGDQIRDYENLFWALLNSNEFLFNH